MNFYLLSTILLVLPIANNADKLSIENLNSVFLSQLRLSVRFVDEPVEQCAKYLQGIRNKLEGIDGKDLTPETKNLNLSILHQVGAMLRTRTPSLNSNSLIAYTDNCADLLSKYQGNDYVLVNQTPEVVQSTDQHDKHLPTNVESAMLKDKLTSLEDENEGLRKQLDSFDSQLEDKTRELASSAAREQARQGELSELSREHENKMAQAQGEIETLRQAIESMERRQEAEREKSRRELELANSRVDSLQMHNDIEAAKVQAQEERNRCVDQLNRANEAKTHCQLDFDKLEGRLQECEKNHNQDRVQIESLNSQLVGVSNEMNRCMSSARDSCNTDREALSMCMDDLGRAKATGEAKNVDAQVACWTEKEEIKEAAMKLHAAIGKIRSERDECYDIASGYKNKARAYDRLTVKAHKLLNKGYDVYCSKWKVRDHNKDDDSDDDDDDD